MNTAELGKLIIEQIPAVHDVIFEDKGQGQYIARLYFHWYILSLSSLRDEAWEKAQTIIEAFKDPGSMILIAVR